MQKQKYASYRNTLAAGRSWEIPCYGNSFRVLDNTSTTNPLVSIDNGPFYEIAAGLGPKGLPDFTKLIFKNPSTLTSMTLWIGIAEGEIDDARAYFDAIPIDDTSDFGIAQDLLLVLAPSHTYLVDNAPAVDLGGGLVEIPITGNIFVSGEYVTISGTVNYNGLKKLWAGGADFGYTDKIVITAAYVAENFAGTELCAHKTPRTIPTNADRKIVSISNMSDSSRIFLTSDYDKMMKTAIAAAPFYTVQAYAGIPVDPMSSVLLNCKGPIYVYSDIAAYPDGVYVSYTEFE